MADSLIADEILKAKVGNIITVEDDREASSDEEDLENDEENALGVINILPLNSKLAS